MNAEASIPGESSRVGWQAFLKLGFEKTASRTVLKDRQRFGPLSVQRAFYPEGDICHVYLLHPPGGVVGGDQLDIDITVKPQAKAFITTPGATKFYLSAGSQAVQKQHLYVDDNALLEWMPQENIFFPGSQVKTELRIDLQNNARAVAWEINCFGRPVINEQFDQGYIDTQWKVYREGKPFLIERLRVDSERINKLSQLNGQPVTGSLMITNADKSLLESVRDIKVKQDPNASDALACTLIEDVLMVRYLGSSTENARVYFTEAWKRCRESAMGQVFQLPRIWNT